jgi:hypothetical protein
MSENKASSSNASETGRITARALGGRRIRVLAHGGMSWRFILQDERYLYWSDREDGTLTRLPKDGGIPLVLATGQAGIRGVALSGGWFYWTTQDKVVRMAEEGSEIEVIAHDEDAPHSIAVHDGTVFWTTVGDMLATGKVKMTRPGDPRVVTIAEQQKQPTSIAVDASRVYWANHGVKRPDYFQDGSVVCAPRDGANGPALIAAEQRLASSIAVDDAWIYWLTAGGYDEAGEERGTLRKRRKDGGEIVELASWDWLDGGALALDATHVYWLAAIHPGLFRVRKDGGETEQLLDREPGAQGVLPHGLVVDDRCVYWTAWDSQSAGGAVFKMAK